MIPTIAALGVIAGAITTIVGFGGGLFLVVVLTAVLSPHTALVLSSAALLVGNLHRVAMLRHAVNPSVVAPYLAGALPGAVAGAMLAVTMPAWLLQVLIILGVMVAYARRLGALSFAPSASHLAPAGLGIGAVSATSGGGGLLQGPLFLASGLTGDAFVASMSAAAVFIHIGRVFGYSSGGLFTFEIAGTAVVLAIAIICGNLLGRRLAVRLAPKARSGIELGAISVCATIGVINLAW